MRSALLFLGLLVCSALALSGVPVPDQGQPAMQQAAGPIVATAASMAAPVFGRDFPDPSVIAAGGRYYAFGTQTGWEPRGHLFPILVSSDLTIWTYAGDAFSRPPAWGRGDWWAPAVVRKGDTFFLYYSGYATSSRMHCVAVATAGSPLGPYTDHGPIACQDGTSAAGYIDASPLVTGGHAYLYFSVDGPERHSISVLPLTTDMLRVAGPRVELFGITQGWERAGAGTVEGPSVFAWGSRYVMLFSGGDWRGRYGMGYAVANSPLGPFVKSGARLLKNGGSLAGPGGGSYFVDTRGRPWMAYHGWSGAGRALYVTPLSIPRPFSAGLPQASPSNQSGTATAANHVIPPLRVAASDATFCSD